ncbi:non-histone protein [Linderina macrospora]|uniref:Non-histone protein n=1 Tax=Linderina macrospora TaxID=4868 RepID=A0ACC1JHN2_9FUNG|nr:non-histone protein [Linderina macrospora]
MSKVQKHHKYRCRDLKRQLEELEEYNEVLAVKLYRSQKRLRRMKIERNLLLERLDRTRRFSDSASDSDVPLKDSFPRAQISDNDAPDPQPRTAAAGRSRRRQNPASSVATPQQQTPSHSSSVDPSAAATTTTTRKSTTNKDPNAPKRPANAFVLFCQAERPGVKNASAEMSSGELTRLMSHRWKHMTEDERKPYFEIYDREKLRYEKEMSSYIGGSVILPVSSAASATSTTVPSAGLVDAADQTSTHDDIEPDLETAPTDVNASTAAPSVDGTDLPAQSVPEEPLSVAVNGDQTHSSNGKDPEAHQQNTLSPPQQPQPVANGSPAANDIAANDIAANDVAVNGNGTVAVVATEATEATETAEGSASSSVIQEVPAQLSTLDTGNELPPSDTASATAIDAAPKYPPDNQNQHPSTHQNGVEGQ